MTRPYLPLFAALLLLPLSACDETGPLSIDEGVDVAVDDAVIARESGDYDTAVDLLNEALDAEPENAVVRVELATTLLQRDGIDLIDIDRIGQFLSSAGTARTAPATAGRSACAYAADPDAVAFDPTGYEGFAELEASIETIQEAKATLEGVLPSAITSFDLCSTVVDGALVYDRAGAYGELVALGLSDDQAAQALAVGALAQFVDAYVAFTRDLAGETTWYRLPDGSIAICAVDEDAARAKAEGAIAGIGQAVLALDARASILGGASVAAEIVDTALDVYNELKEDIATYCEG